MTSTSSVKVVPVDVGRMSGSDNRRRIVKMTLDEAKMKGRVKTRLFDVLARKRQVYVYDVDPSPIAILVGLGLAVGKEFGESVLDRLIDSVMPLIAPYVELPPKFFAIDVHRDKIINAVKTSFYDQAFSPTSEDASGVNIDEQHMDNTIVDVSKATVVLTSMVSEDAGEMGMEALSQAISQAVYSGLAGQLQNMANYRAGYLPPQNLHTEDAYANVHPDTQAIMDAFAGYQIHETITTRALTYIQQASDAYRRFQLLEDVDASIEAVGNVHVTWLSEAHRLIRDAVHRLIDDVRAMLYTLLRRVTDILNEVRVAEADHNAGLLTPEEHGITLYDAWLELNEIENELNAILDDLEQTVKNMPTSLDDVLEKLKNVASSLETLFGEYVDSTILDDFSTYVERVLAIRGGYVRVKNVGWYIINSATGKYHGASTQSQS